MLTRCDELRARALAQAAGIPWLVLPQGSEDALGWSNLVTRAGTFQRQQTTHAPWIVLDVPTLQVAQVRSWQSMGYRVAVIEDAFSEGGAAADVLINPNPRGEEDSAVSGHPGQQRLLGTDFVMLHHPRSTAVPVSRFCSERTRRVLISMGAADPMHLTETALTLVREQVDRECEVQVIAGPLFAPARIDALAAKMNASTTLLRAPESLTASIAWAELAVLCGGNTLWEAFYAGCPVASFAHSELQARILRRLDVNGALLLLGSATDLDLAIAAQRLRAIVTNVELRQALSRRGHRLIDGCGAERIVAVLRRMAA